MALLLACAWLVTAGAALAQDKPQTQPVTVKDPVCGMKIDPAKAKGKAEHQGKTYYFCSDDCKARFEKEPAKFAEKKEEKK
jgi:YHS domain-containing protein